MPGIGDVRRWSPGGLDSGAGVLLARRTTLVELQDELDASVHPTQWVGDAADAARTRHTQMSEALRRLVAQVEAMRTAMIGAADSAGAVLQALREADELAARYYFHIGDDGVVREAVPDGLMMSEDDAADRGRLLAELVDRVEQVLRTATDVDAELARVLRAAARDEIDDGTGAALLGASVAGIGQGQDQAVLPPPGGGSPADNNAYWDTLTEAQRKDLIDQHPELVGNLDGIPAAARDDANRTRLPAEIVAAEAELARAQHAFDNPSLASQFGQLVAGDLGTTVDDDLRRAEEKLAALRAVERATENGGQLLVLDSSGEMVKAAVAAGDVDTADHVSVSVPGMTTTVQQNLESQVDQTAALREQTDDQLRAQGRGGETVATVAWLGYEPPGWGSFTDDWDITDTVATSGQAEEGGASLAGFVNGVDASRADDPHLTTLAHSYGSTTAGYGLQRGTGVDDAVFYGSPGLGTSDVADLGVTPGHVYVAEAQGDPVADLGTFGTDPNLLPGVTHLSTQAGVSPDGVDRTASSGHSEYTRDGTMSQYNQSTIVAGMPDRVVTGTDVGAGDGVGLGVRSWF